MAQFFRILAQIAGNCRVGQDRVASAGPPIPVRILGSYKSYGSHWSYKMVGRRLLRSLVPPYSLRDFSFRHLAETTLLSIRYS
jgi:hypothetical protein